jgi:excisionase family DNA binding protein
MKSNDTAAAAYGRAVMAQEEIAAAQEKLDRATARIERLESLVRFLEENLKRLEQPKELLTEKEAAELLRVSLRTMRNWRSERPARLPFILFEGGDVRYRADAIENYLNSRERGSAKTAALRAA